MSYPAYLKSHLEANSRERLQNTSNQRDVKKTTSSNGGLSGGVDSHVVGGITQHQRPMTSVAAV